MSTKLWKLKTKLKVAVAHLAKLGKAENQETYLFSQQNPKHTQKLEAPAISKGTNGIKNKRIGRKLV